MKLVHALRVQPRDVIAFVGGGGKTTAMFRLADELVAQGKRVVTTTTTRLSRAQIDLTPIPPSPLPPLLMLKCASGEGEGGWGVGGEALSTHPHILIVGEEVEGDKVAGVPPELIDELAADDRVDAVIYEADGARLLPFKAPAAHEPVVANSTTLLAPVIGVTALGAPLDDAHVHRAEIVARLAGARLGEPVTPLIAARVLAHPDGGLKRKPQGARARVLINQVESDSQMDPARALARLLLNYDAIDAVAIGAVRNVRDPIRETHRRVAAIVLAAGAGTRVGGRIKQLLPWRGKTLIENAIDLAARSHVVETVVVLGAHAEEIRAVIQATPVRIVVNRQWEEGHSTSIRAGLNALSSRIDAAIFINADQPLLTSAVVNQIIQRYRETDASIIVPLYAGARGSPALFDRKHWSEFATLRGEQGGRELLAKYPVARVEFAEARLGTDVDTLEEYEKLT